MSNVYVFSAANAAARSHWRDTIEQGKPLTEVLRFVADEEVRQALIRNYSDGTTYLWAGRSGGQDELYWNQMASGDLLLGYRARAIVSAAFLVTRIKSANLGLWAWPDVTERPFDLIYFMTKPEFVNRHISEFPYFGEVYQGLRRLGRSEDLIGDYGDGITFVREALGGAGRPDGLGESAISGQGRMSDPIARSLIERRAVSLARQHYENLGFAVEDTGKTHPFDFRCTKPDEELRVEIKGTTGALGTVFLTSGEVLHARTAPCPVDLIVVTGIRLVREAGTAVRAEGGAIAANIRRWTPAEGDLTPVQYSYRVPRAEQAKA